MPHHPRVRTLTFVSQCLYCLELIQGPKAKHEDTCISNPIAAAGKIPKKKTRLSAICQFCGAEFPQFNELHEHEDLCAPVHITRYMCPSFQECGQDCFYFSIDEDRATRHARASNRRTMDEPDDERMRCPVRNNEFKPLSEDVMELVIRPRDQ